MMVRFPQEISQELGWPRKQDGKRYVMFSEYGQWACLARKQRLHKGGRKAINRNMRSTS